jgi:glycine betaine transporter
MHFLVKLRSKVEGRELFVGMVTLCGVIAILGLVWPSGLASVGAAVSSTAFDSLGWLFLTTVSALLLLCLWLAFSRYGRLTLGQTGDEPEFSTASWLAMLFAAGMGSGLLFWGVAEPVIHYADPPVPPGCTPEAARRALVQTAFHWGIHAWAVYCMGGLVLAYFGFRKGTPYLPGAPLRHVFRGRWVTPVAGLADLIGVLAVAAGVGGSLGAGILQLRTGLSAFAGTPADSTLMAFAILGVLMIAYLISASTSLDKGIKWLSNINMGLAIALMLFVLAAGPTSFLLDVFATGIGDYVAALPSLSLRLFPYRDLEAWTHSWTLTYFIWWIAWAPFVGVFIARISKGRTIREFVTGVLLAPTAFSLLWFAVFGGAGMHEELHGAGGIVELVNEDVTVALFALFDRLPLAAVLSGVAAVLLFVFLVTSADSATYVLGMLTSHGSLVPSTRRKLLWGLVIGGLGGALMLTGNIDVLKSVIVTGAIPFTFVMLLQVVALLRALRSEDVPRRPGGRGGGAALGLVLVAGSCWLLAGCGGDAPLRVGVKSFTEQQVLGEVGVRLLRDEGLAVEAPVLCGDTYECHRALSAGEIDLMIEYSGTAWLFLGESLPPSGVTLAAVRARYEPLDLTWLGALGLDNGYRMVVAADRAVLADLDDIGDLARGGGEVRVTCPGEYLRRPADGLAALSRRYGLRLAPDPLVLETPVERVEALVDGRVDVAVVYATDAVMTDPRLVELDDPLGFFPPYEAAYLVRAQALRDHPEIRDALGKVESRLDTSAMQRLNHAVQLQGRQPAAVARTYLVGEELLSSDVGVGRWEPDLRIVHPVGDDLAPYTAVAQTSVLQAMPRRTVHQAASDDPLAEVGSGAARLAVVGAETFFDPVMGREERAEAVAVLGFRTVHVLTRTTGSDPFAGAVGVAPAGSGAGRVGRDMLALTGIEPALSARPAELLDALRAGEIDTALMMTHEGDTDVALALQQDGMSLRSLGGWLTAERAAGCPYLRETRIPAGTYTGQDAPLDSLGSQVVLAGPAPRLGAAGAGGPAAALPSSGLPLSRAQVVALADAAGVLEAPDPALPSAWTRAPVGSRRGSRAADTLDTVLNALAVMFLVWLGWLLVRREPRVRPDPS